MDSTAKGKPTESKSPKTASKNCLQDINGDESTSFVIEDEELGRAFLEDFDLETSSAASLLQQKDVQREFLEKPWTSDSKKENSEPKLDEAVSAIFNEEEVSREFETPWTPSKEDKAASTISPMKKQGIQTNTKNESATSMLKDEAIRKEFETPWTSDLAKKGEIVMKDKPASSSCCAKKSGIRVKPDSLLKDEKIMKEFDPALTSDVTKNEETKDDKPASVVKKEEIKSEPEDPESASSHLKDEVVKKEFLEPAWTSDSLKKEDIKMKPEEIESKTGIIKKEEIKVEDDPTPSTSRGRKRKAAESKSSAKKDDPIPSTSRGRKRKAEDNKSKSSAKKDNNPTPSTSRGRQKKAEDNKSKSSARKSKKNRTYQPKTYQPKTSTSAGWLHSSNFIKIGNITRTVRSIDVKGKVIYKTRVHEFEVFRGMKSKMYFDLADETGIIRVYAWGYTAVSVGQLLQLDGSIVLKNVQVESKHELFNNMDHAYQLKFKDRAVPKIRVLDTPIQAIELAARFIPYEEVRRKRAADFFDVTGKIKSFHSSYGGDENDLKIIELEDDNGGTLNAACWNEYIAVTKDMIGKTMDVLRCKYESSFNNVNLTGAHIKIDGRRVEDYHLASPKSTQSDDGDDYDGGGFDGDYYDGDYYGYGGDGCRICDMAAGGCVIA